MAAEDETPQLWQPEQAVAFLLAAPGSTPASTDDGAEVWDGALGAGITRFDIVCRILAAFLACA